MQKTDIKANSELLKIVIACITIIFVSFTVIMATENNIVSPTDNQYLELRAVEVKEKDGEKQVIMELWGHDLKFKRI